MSINTGTKKYASVVKDPPLAKLLFTDVRFSVIWFALRVWLGLRWIDAAAHKLDNPAWMDTGDALKGYWTGIVQIPEGGRPPIAFDWYRSFIQNLLDAEAYVWFAKMVAVGELLIGIALIIGAFVGIAAFFAGFMNWNFIMAGSASTNGLLFVAAVLLVLAWKTAGYIGADFFLLRYIGTPWRRKAWKAAKEENPIKVPGIA